MSNKDFKFEVGKSYKIRDGSGYGLIIANDYRASDHCGALIVHQKDHDGESFSVSVHNLIGIVCRGRYADSHSHSDIDLLPEEYVPRKPWDDESWWSARFGEWVKSAAVDENGELFGYMEKPKLGNIGKWHNNGDDYTAAPKHLRCPELAKLPWKESHVMRPEVEK